ncbi:MAG: YbgC/FadM family acyl-CoA thioesterase [Candidatus Omnitrophica bacterium]|nr:YbgC/FadM family acyl-CoA thioesterase [Candidatus Omnitrophota bacterium]
MERRIYYHDTDSGGVVYYANYLKYMEEARTEYLQQHGLLDRQLKERNFLYAVRQCLVKYKAPARYGDSITCDAVLTKMTAAQLIFDQTVRNKETGQILVEAQIALVCLTPEFKPTQLPDYFRKGLGEQNTQALVNPP